MSINRENTGMARVNTAKLVLFSNTKHDGGSEKVLGIRHRAAHTYASNIKRNSRFMVDSGSSSIRARHRSLAEDQHKPRGGTLICQLASGLFKQPLSSMII